MSRCRIFVIESGRSESLACLRVDINLWVVLYDIFSVCIHEDGRWAGSWLLPLNSASSGCHGHVGVYLAACRVDK